MEINIIKMDEEFEKKVTGNITPIREMSTLEIYGARYLTYRAYLDWCEGVATEPSSFDDMDNDWYVNSDKLYTSECEVMDENSKRIVLYSVFCIQGSAVLFGWACDSDKLEEYNCGGGEDPGTYLVRIN